MFASSGYFKGINCPFFASGLCDRPNCHFRHVEETPQILSYTPTAAKPHSLLNLVGNASRQLTRTSTLPVISSAAPQYIPTPISVLEELKRQKSESISTRRITLSDVAQIDLRPNNDFSATLNKDNAISSQNVTLAASNPIEYHPTSLKRKNFGDDDDNGDVAESSSKKIKTNHKLETNSKDAASKTSETVSKVQSLRLGSEENKTNANKSLIVKTKKDKSPEKSKTPVKDAGKSAVSVSDKSPGEHTKKPSKKVECKIKSDNKEPEERKITHSKSSHKPTSSVDSHEKSMQQKVNNETKRSLSKETPSDNVNIKKVKSSTLSPQPTGGSSHKIQKVSHSKSLSASGEGSEIRKSKSAAKSDEVVVKKISKEEKCTKVKETSRKSSVDLEYLKMAESKQLEMALFGDPVSLSNVVKSKKSIDSATERGKISKEKVFSKDGKLSKTSTSNKIDGSSSSFGENKIKHVKSCNDILSSPSKIGRNSSSKDRTCQELVRQSKSVKPLRPSSSPKSYQQSSKKITSKNQDDRISESSVRINNSDDDCDEGLGDDDDDDEDDVTDDVATSRFKECYRIFMEHGNLVESKVKVKNELPVSPTLSPSSADDLCLVGKKRVAHATSQPPMRQQLPNKMKKSVPDHRKVMLDRLSEARQNYERESVMSELVQQPVKDKHAVVSSAKGSRRLAHVPSKEVLKRPVITFNVESNIVPVNFRLQCLNKIIDTCLSIYDNEQDAHLRALAEEQILMTNCGARLVYQSRFTSLIIRLRKEMPPEKSGDVKQPVLNSKVMLYGKSALGGNFTLNLNRSLKATPITLTPTEMYKRLQDYILDPEQVKANGFPYRDPETNAICATPNQRYPIAKGLDASSKICCRCGKEFIILNNGNYLKKEECIYHWGHFWRKRVAGSIENRYNCCGGGIADRGCQVAQYHVHEDNKSGNFTGFVETMPCSPRMDGYYGLYALDCEMVYTVAGCELARITVVDFNLKVVYDKLIKPDSPVVDYNSRFSGIKEADMENVKTTIRDVQAVLLTMFNSKTILIGHSLENDLMALKLLHQSIVDTSVVFPHRLGPPYKRALKNLAVDILKKSIQENVNGHDSKEDSAACMELMMCKVKEDIKKLQRRASRD